METYINSFIKLSTVFLLGIVSYSSAMAEATVTQNDIVMQRRGYCDPNQLAHDTTIFQESKPCSVVFANINNTFIDLGVLKLNSVSSMVNNRAPLLSLFAYKLTYSLSTNGTVNTLTYTQEDPFTRETRLSPGYYAIRDSTGLYWSAYLNYQDSGKYVTWDSVNDPAHPWQACSEASSFNREIGCGNGTNPTTPRGNASIFDGAGSIISPVEDCYGCNKDWANMQPHQNSSSTVVFQWRTVPQGCKTLAIGLPEEGLPQGNISLPVTISAKTWSDTAIRKSYTAALSKAGYFALESLGEWTTFAVTSNTPLTNSVTIEAKCADGFSGVAAQEINAANVLVDNAIQWMGTGSVISRAQQGDKYGYGMTKDVSIGSNTSSALTSFQWDSSNCSSLQIGNDTANAKVFGKVWNGASFDEMCNSLPCNLNNIAPNYYIFKIVSSAGAFPNDTVTANCH